MKTHQGSNIPNHIVMDDRLKEKPKALLYYLYTRANIECEYSYKCKIEYKDILEALDIPFDRNYKNKVRKLLNSLDCFISYEENSLGTLEITSYINKPIAERGKTKGFTKIPYTMINNKDIPLILMPTYLAILLHDFGKGECNPSLQTIAKYSGCSVNTCKARIKALEDLNLLQVERTKGGGYGKAVNTNTFYTSNGESYYYELLEVHNLRYEYQEETMEETTEENVIEFNTKSLELEQKETTEDKEYLDTRVIEFEPKESIVKNQIRKDNTIKRNNKGWDIEDDIKNDIKKEPKSSHLFSPNYDLCH